MDKNDSKNRLDLCPDIVFCLNKEKFQHDSSISLNIPRPIVAITLREWDFPEVKSREEKRIKRERYLSAFEEICKSIFHIWGGSVVIFPQVRGPGIFENDRIISDILRERLKKKIPARNLLFLNFQDITSSFYIVDLLSQCDLIIATRFHSAIFALISGIPAISITYQHKSAGTMKLLGLEHFCVNIEDISAQEIIILIGEILAHPAHIKKKIENKVSEIKKEIELKLENAMESIFRL